jgi:hypothetical protein
MVIPFVKFNAAKDVYELRIEVLEYVIDLSFPAIFSIL